MNPSSHSHHSIVLERPAHEVWDVVRDFNSYPRSVDGVDDSHIEEHLSGTTVGGVRNLGMGGVRTRQRSSAHSDADRFFTHAGCDPFEIESDGSARTLVHYEGTLKIRSISRVTAPSRSGRPGTSARPRMPTTGLSGGPSESTWLGSLRNYLDRTPG